MELLRFLRLVWHRTVEEGFMYFELVVIDFSMRCLSGNAGYGSEAIEFIEKTPAESTSEI